MKLTSVLMAASAAVLLLVGCAGGPAKHAGPPGKPQFVAHDSWGITNIISDRGGVVTNITSYGNVVREVEMPRGWIFGGPRPFLGPSPVQPVLPFGSPSSPRHPPQWYERPPAWVRH